jgi:hypothetical protein
MVHAIEVADREHTATMAGFDVVEASDDFHGAVL